MRTTTAPRYLSRVRFSASDRPIPPDFDVAAFMTARRAKRGAFPTIRARSARLARWFASLVARLASVRRAATLALTLMLATGVGAGTGDGATEGAGS